MRMLLGFVLAATLVNAAKTLDVYFVDVEGGQATLIVTPNKESILVDTGWPGFNGRDADRIKAAAKSAGVKQIDYLILTHYHRDHAGGVSQLVERLPVRTFVDHGPNGEDSTNGKESLAAWEKALATGKRLSVKAGDKIPLKGVDLQVVAANGEVISSAVNGVGSGNAACASAPEYPADPTENARSLGFLLTYGKFRMINLGDLTSQKEASLVCPQNRLGTVDLYVTAHHGLDTSNPQPLVHALAPRVAVMNNGARKGGSPKAWSIIKSSPGLEDLWQVHFAMGGGSDANVADSFIANLNEVCEGQSLKVSAMNDGSFTVLNNRNKYSKSYAAKH
jgi:competence protein ComEC